MVLHKYTRQCSVQLAYVIISHIFASIYAVFHNKFAISFIHDRTISSGMHVLLPGNTMVVNEYCRGKESQQLAVVGKNITKPNSQDGLVVGVMMSDVSRHGCNLHFGQQTSLTCIEWIKELIDFDEYVMLHYLLTSSLFTLYDRFGQM